MNMDKEVSPYYEAELFGYMPEYDISESGGGLILLPHENHHTDLLSGYRSLNSQQQ